MLNDQSNGLLWKTTIEIVDFPIQDGDFPQQTASHYQRVPGVHDRSRLGSPPGDVFNLGAEGVWFEHDNL